MALERLRRPLEPAIRRILHLYWRFARGMTLGVRAIVVNESGQVFLVEHSYVTGWHLPGGGVETGETLREALARELMEEGGLVMMGEPVLHGIFHNAHASRPHSVDRSNLPSTPRPTSGQEACRSLRPRWRPGKTRRMSSISNLS